MINITKWPTEEILGNGLAYYNTALKALTDPILRQNLDAELINGAIIGRDVELGAAVTVEKGAVILGQTKILRGRVEAGAVVVNCVAQSLQAKSGSLLFLIEQFNERPTASKRGQLLTDVIILDEKIVRKVRLDLRMDAPLDKETVLVNGRPMTVGELVALSHFDTPYPNGSSSTQFRRVLQEHSLDELFGQVDILTRFEGNPILEPILDHPWESKMVYNAAVIRLDGVTYIVYRASGDDHLSRLGLAWSGDGIHIDGRLPHPIFTPQTAYELPETAVQQTRPREKGGCEDPRLTLIGDRIYMTYSAYSDVLQIALASISKEDFITLPQTAEADMSARWTRHGPLFPGLLDRNSILFPEKIGGQYVLLHRSMFEGKYDITITFSDSLETPWPGDFETIMSVRPDMWDSGRVGAGAQVLKTRRGWLLIYHGVGLKRGRRAYMLGTALLDLDDPRKVLYRSLDPIFTPKEDYELYGWAPTVVFTNGVAARTKDANEIIEEEDEIMVYYGGGDRVIGVAWAKLSDLLPKSI